MSSSIDVLQLKNIIQSVASHVQSKIEQTNTNVRNLNKTIQAQFKETDIEVNALEEKEDENSTAIEETTAKTEADHLRVDTLEDIVVQLMHRLSILESNIT